LYKLSSQRRIWTENTDVDTDAIREDSHLRSRSSVGNIEGKIVIFACCPDRPHGRDVWRNLNPFALSALTSKSAIPLIQRSCRASSCRSCLTLKPASDSPARLNVSPRAEAAGYLRSRIYICDEPASRHFAVGADRQYSERLIIFRACD
jgi:hypothetical protein